MCEHCSCFCLSTVCVNMFLSVLYLNTVCVNTVFACFISEYSMLEHSFFVLYLNTVCVT